MVDTIKFSQMTNAGNINNNDIMPSLRSNENVILNNPWTFLPPGDTASRPAPSSTINYRLRFNTEDQLYEYYDAILMMWTQLQESAFTVGPFITYTLDASLPDAQNLADLSNGILKQTITSGNAILDIAVNGTDFYGPGFTGYFQSPAGIKDSLGNIVVAFNTVGSGANNYLTLLNAISPGGVVISADGVGTNIDVTINGKGTGALAAQSQTGTIPFYMEPNVLSNIYRISFDVPTLTSNRVVTWPDASGTISFAGTASDTFDGDSGSATPAAGVITFTGGTTGLTFTGASSTMTLGGILVPANGGLGTSTAPSAGQIPIGTSGGDYVPASVSSGQNILVGLGSGTMTIGITGQIPLANGGTNASLTASNGGIVYSTASAFAILAGTATANLPLLSGSSGAPSWGAFALSLGGALTTAGAFTMSGAHSFTGTLTADTSVIFPTSGTLATTSGSVATLTGDSGTATASSGNINVVGTGSGLTFTGSGATLTLGGTLNVSHGGTGLAAITAHNLIIGNGTSAATLLAPSATSGIPLISQGSSADPAYGTAVVAGGGTGVTSVTISPTATAFAGWDANKNLSMNNALEGYATTATAGGTTTLTVASAFNQFFTGTLNQTVVMPVTSTLALGQQWYFVNNSSGTLTIQSSGANTIVTMAANTTASLTCILTSGTSAASWFADYQSQGIVLPLSLANGGTGQSLVSVNSAVMSTTAGGAVQLSTTLPSGLSATNINLTTPTLGVASATSINFGGSTLSNYVTGSWTPVLSFGGGSTGITYSAQQGEYTQIGNVVYVRCFISLSNKGSSTGSAAIAGLPVAPVDSNHFAPISYSQNLLFHSGIPSVDFLSGSTINLYYQQSGAGVGTYAETDFTNSTALFFEGFYFTS